MATKFKKRIMIDLDGVLNEYNGKYNPNEIPEIKSGAREFIQKLFTENDYELVLFTTRTKELTVKWLIKNDIYRFFTEVTDKKLSAFIYLDDRAIQFNGDFAKTEEQIKNFKVYWK